MRSLPLPWPTAFSLLITPTGWRPVTAPLRGPPVAAPLGWPPLTAAAACAVVGIAVAQEEKGAAHPIVCSLSIPLFLHHSHATRLSFTRSPCS